MNNKKKVFWELELPKNKPKYLLPEQWKRLKTSGTSGLKHICQIPEYENFKGTFEFFLNEEKVQYLIKTIHLKKVHSWGKCQKTPPLYFTQKRVTKCSGCGRTIPDNEKIFRGLCKDCFTTFAETTGYRCDHISGISGLRLGIEIEIDDASLDYGDLDEDEDYQEGELDGWGDIPMLHGWTNKSDSSLHYGREFTSPICSPKQLKADVKNFGGRLPDSIETGRAGIHIHVNKGGYLSKVDVKKLIKIFYQLPESEAIGVLGRGYGCHHNRLSSPWGNGTHGQILNTQGATVEFRGFRAIHSTEWYLYCIETVISMCEYVRNTGYMSVSWNGWKKWNETYKGGK